MPKPKKMEPGSFEWIDALKIVVMGNCPPLVSCKNCGKPNRMGFVCSCGCDDPGDNEINISEWMDLFG